VGNGNREFILGGQRSGKSRTAEARALLWLQDPAREAVLLATAEAGDAEMAERIERHRRDRRNRAPRLGTIETGSPAAALLAASSPSCLVVVDCLTLWLTRLMMPLSGEPLAPAPLDAAIDELVGAAAAAAGPWIMVSNEIGLGVAPISPESRRFVDRLGFLHQRLAALADRVTLMVAGCECTIRAPAR
jgi:adenosylcobinamide kinase/adenosylcobinamide-phosphate guanylyltransferase